MFTSEINNASVYYINKYLSLSENVCVDTNAKTTIEFSVEPDYRSWGIKSIDISIKSIRTSIHWEVDATLLPQYDMIALQNAGGNKYGELICGSIDINTEFDDQWEIDKSELEFKPNGAFLISGVDITLTTKKIELY